MYYKTNGGPLFSVGGQPGPLAAAPPAAPTAGRGGRGGGNYQNTQPMGASANVFGTWDPLTDWTPAAAPAADAPAAGGRGAGRGGAGGAFAGRGGGGGGRGGAGGGTLLEFLRPRVILAFPPDARDMLLSGGNLGGENLENRLDHPPYAWRGVLAQVDG